MLKSKGLFWGLLAAGCSAAPERVRIDVNAVVLQRGSPRSIPAPPLPTPPAAPGPIRIVMPARPAESVADPSRSNLDALRRLLAEEQRRELLNLERRLRRFYAEDSDRFEQEQLRLADVHTREAYAKVSDRVREIFVRYGERRAPLVIDLALLVDWPDPNPQSIPPKGNPNKSQQREFAVAKALRAEIAALEAGFSAAIKGLFSDVDASVAKEMERIRLAIEKYRAENDLRAEREARDQVSQSEKLLDLKLAQPAQLQLPALPERAFSTPRGALMPSPPQVQSSQIDSLAAAMPRATVERLLTVWLAQNRYVLAADRQAATDRTKEFSEWIRARHPGP